MLASVWLHLIVFAFVLAQHALHVERLTLAHPERLAPVPVSVPAPVCKAP